MFRVFQFFSTEKFFNNRLNERFQEIPQAAGILIRLVKLQFREFGIMNRVNSFVSEKPAYFVNLVKTGNQKPLEVKLRRYS